MAKAFSFSRLDTRHTINICGNMDLGRIDKVGFWAVPHRQIIAVFHSLDTVSR
jgi:hypothetical protein